MFERRIETAARRAGSAARTKLCLGAAYEGSGYVLVDEAGRPLSPHALTSRWSRLLAAAGVPPVRLHDARHTCGTLMHLEGVPIAVIAAWLGHASSAFTMATYVHSQEPALADAARSLGRVVTNS
jgi:integrase